MTLSEVSLDELEPGLLLVLPECHYYGVACQVAGKVKSLEVLGVERYLHLILTGTDNENILKVCSGQPSQEFRVHLCPNGCPQDEVGDLVVHARVGRVVIRPEEESDWVRNLEAVRPPLPHDELAGLRARAEEAAPGPAGVPEVEAKEPSSSSSGSKRKKKKKKKKDKKKARSSKEKVKDLEEEKRAKKLDKSEEKASDKTNGRHPRTAVVKSQKALFGGTGLDPSDRVRRRVLKRARVYMQKKTKEKDTSSTSSGSTSLSGSSIEEGDPQALFQEGNKARVLCEKFPGVLTQAALSSMREALLTELGEEVEKSSPKATALLYFRQHLVRKASGPVARDLLNVATALDYLVKGQRASGEGGRRFSPEAESDRKHPTRDPLVSCSETGVSSPRGSGDCGKDRTSHSTKGDIRGCSDEIPGNKSGRKRKDQRSQGAGQRRSRRWRQRSRSTPRQGKGRQGWTEGRLVGEEETESSRCGESVRYEGEASHGYEGGKPDVDEENALRAGVSSGGHSPRVATVAGTESLEGGDSGGNFSSQLGTISSKDEGAVSGATDPGFQQSSPAMTFDVRGPDKKVHACFSGEGRTLKNLGSFLLQGILEVVPLRSKSMGRQNRGSLFPLPTSRDILKERVPEFDDESLSWLLGLFVSLNSFWGGDVFCDKPINEVQEGCIFGLVADVSRVVEFKSEIPRFDWKQFFQTRSIDYQGDEVKIARYFDWDNIRHALPAEIGRVPLVDVCTQGARYFVENIDLTIKPKSKWGPVKAPRVMVRDAHWEAVCDGLIKAGLCTVIPREEIFETEEGPLLNCLFGVSKDEFVGDTEVFRLIMNLVPFNAISESVAGDVATLPTCAMMNPLFLQPTESLLVSSEDVRCFFYVMAVPPAWVKFLAFNKAVPQSCLRDELSGRECYLASLVLPMGYLNSVSLAQHVHRNLALASQRFSHHEDTNSTHCELRKDLPFTVANPQWRIYLDNYDLLERVEATKLVEVTGSEAPGILDLRAEYEDWDIPRNHKKAVTRSTNAELQGAQVDGIAGVAFPKESKLLKYVTAALHLCHQGLVTQRQVQVVAGGLVYMSMFRRPLLGGLNNVWGFIESFNNFGRQARPLPASCKLEILRFLCMIPMARMDFRLDVHPLVTCSDASEHGGGLCVSRGLSSLGELVRGGRLRGEGCEANEELQVLCVGLFDGISGLRVALDLLGCGVIGHISVESNPQARRVVESHFPNVEVVTDINLVDSDLVKRWSLSYSQATLVIQGAGPPCQGVSGLNFDRKGALKDERSCLFTHGKRIKELLKTHFPWCQVHSLMESVASMDPTDCDTMSDSFGDLPWSCDSGEVSWCSRPRLYWMTWELQEDEGVELRHEAVQGRREVHLYAHQALEEVCKVGWLKVDPSRPFPTFTTSRPRSSPGRKPAGLHQCTPEEVALWQQDLYRFPPYQYAARNSLINRQNVLRVPDLEEREYMMGFPVGYTKSCLSKSQAKNKTLLNDTRLTLLGNSWSVPVVAWFLGQLLAPLGFIEPHSPQGIVDKINPVNLWSVQSRLLRRPLNPVVVSTSPDSQVQLVRQLSNLVSIKGEDILLNSSTSQMTKFHRLRASVPSRLWRWKIVSGWKWTGNREHINSLELRAVLTSLKWRIEHQRLVRQRFLHLTDSLLCLHCLSRGRSSSRKLRRTMCRVNALLLVSSCQALWGYVHTEQNPADKPSRWGLRVKTKFRNAKKGSWRYYTSS